MTNPEIASANTQKRGDSGNIHVLQLTTTHGQTVWSDKLPKDHDRDGLSQFKQMRQDQPKNE